MNSCNAFRIFDSQRLKNRFSFPMALPMVTRESSLNGNHLTALFNFSWARRPNVSYLGRNVHTAAVVEDVVLMLRCELRELNAMGDYGGRAVHGESADACQMLFPKPLSGQTLNRLV